MEEIEWKQIFFANGNHKRLVSIPGKIKKEKGLCQFLKNNQEPQSFLNLLKRQQTQSDHEIRRDLISYPVFSKDNQPFNCTSFFLNADDSHQQNCIASCGECNFSE